MLRHLLHYGIHFLVPILIALFFFKRDRVKVGLILLAGILLDVDHLLANPIFDPDRCSIGFHPLHSYVLIPFYLGLALWKRTRLLGLALVIHIIADVTDCLFLKF
ncbi:hypothetical protein FGF1_04300 [Flavobacteriaceae bacterium GF1]